LLQKYGHIIDFLLLTLVVTMLSHPRAVHPLEDLPDLRCALEAQIAHSCPQPLEHPDGSRIRAKPVFIALLPFTTKT
jgi:hypothetical protein